MPTYEYRCPDGHDFERFYRKISDATSDVVCPVCGKKAERILSKGAGFAFKGSGFYLTDYGKNAHRSSGPAAKADGGESGSGDSAAAATASGSKEGSSDSGASGSGEAKPAGEPKAASDAKPAPATKAAPESKPAPSGGSNSSKDK